MTFTKYRYGQPTWEIWLLGLVNTLSAQVRISKSTNILCSPRILSQLWVSFSLGLSAICQEQRNHLTRRRKRREFGATRVSPIYHPSAVILLALSASRHQLVGGCKRHRYPLHIMTARAIRRCYIWMCSVTNPYFLAVADGCVKIVQQNR